MKQPSNIDCDFVPAVPWEAVIAYAEAHVGDVGVEPNEGYQPAQESLFELAARQAREAAARDRGFEAMRAAVEIANLEYMSQQAEWNELLAGGGR